MVVFESGRLLDTCAGNCAVPPEVNDIPKKQRAREHRSAHTIDQKSQNPDTHSTPQLRTGNVSPDLNVLRSLFPQVNALQGL